jgi:DnaK suppressor protein
MNAARLKKLLVELRAQTRAEKPARIEPNRRDAAATGVPDEDEQALSEMLQTLASQRNRKQAELVQQIDRALSRLKSEPDLAGLCEECEEPIPDKRLEAVPYATMCAACRSKRDKKRGPTRRGLTDFE